MQKIHQVLTSLSFEGNVSSLVGYEFESLMISVMAHRRLTIWSLARSVVCLCVYAYFLFDGMCVCVCVCIGIYVCV